MKDNARQSELRGLALAADICDEEHRKRLMLRATAPKDATRHAAAAWAAAKCAELIRAEMKKPRRT